MRGVVPAERSESRDPVHTAVSDLARRTPPF